MIRLDFPNGVFPAVALRPGFGWMAVREGDPRVPGWLKLYEWVGTDVRNAQEIQRWGMQAGSPCFPNLHVLDDLLWQAHHDGRRQRLTNLSGGIVMDFEGLSGPTAFGGDFFAYTEPLPPYRVHRINLRSGEVTQPRNGAPTGLSRIVNGNVITVDEDRHALPGASIPSFAGDLAVGEGQTGGVMWRAGGRVDALWFPLDSFTPKCAEDGDRKAIATAGSGTVRLFCGSLDDLRAESAKLPEPIVRIGRPMWFGCFAGRRDSGGGWSTDTDPSTLPGNCYLLIPDGLLCRKDGTPIARYVEGRPDTDIDAIERAIAVAPHDLPILAYVPRQVPRMPRGADWLGIECYRLASETVQSFELRIRNTVRTALNVVLLPQAFTSNTSLTQDLASIPPVISRIARDFTSVIGALAFNGSGRATGLQSHPDVRLLWEEFAAGIPSAPPLTVPSPPPVPKPKPPAPQPPPQPPVPPIVNPWNFGDLLMLSTLIDPAKKLIAVQSVKGIAGTPLSVLVMPGDRVFSCQPDGSAGDRDPGADGGYERCRVAGNVATFQPVSGKFYTFGFVVVEGL